jgi:predicted helicase
MADLASLVLEYLKNLAKAANAPGAAPELSLRPSLDKLLQDTIRLLDRETQFNLVNEGTTAGVKGRPDFILYSHDSPSGYAEAESIDANLKKLTGHAKHQNDHYRANLDNFLLTNHLDFELWHEGKRIATASLPDPRDSLSVPTPQEIHNLHLLFERFFGAPAINLPALRDPRDLAEALARRTRQLNNSIHTTLLTEPSSYLHTLKKSFEAELLPNLTDDEFADLYAQTVAYGLFAARCSIQNDAVAEKKFDRLHASEFIPTSNPFLSELFQQITSRNLTADIKWITDDIARLLRAAPYVSVRPQSQRSTRSEDPVIHFYETFLAAYDPKLREKRGVYYTPEPVVSYIIRSVDEILVSSFGKKDGLADDSVKILDPATGTGTFLAQTILHIYDRFRKAGNEGFFSPEYVEKKLVPRLFGFELMVAPYTIAHLKLHLLLKDLCPAYNAKRRLEVYLTNTLEPPQTHPELAFAQYISKENNAAASIKANEDILVIIGNPPYSGHSANASKYDRDRPDLNKKKGDLTPIGQLLHGQPIIKEDKKAGIAGDNPKQPNYFMCDGKPLGERKLWLNDDYVKFIRFSQWRIDRTGEGILGFITNHGFLDNPTFRGMRQALMQSFHEIHILDLHGNDRKKEIDPATGLKDENVFDIQQGVAIILALKKKNYSGACKVFHKDLFGKWVTRVASASNAKILGGKYGWLLENSLKKTEWNELRFELQVEKPLYLFQRSGDADETYDAYPSVRNLFASTATGVQTSRDSLVVGFSPEEVAIRLTEFSDPNIPDNVIRQKYFLGKAVAKYLPGDTRGWDLSVQRKLCSKEENRNEWLAPYCYRPFDKRTIILDKKMVDWPRPEITRHLTKPNLSLSIGRAGKNIEAESWDLVSASNSPVDLNFYRRGGAQVFPLYLYPPVQTLQTANPQAYRVPNFSEDFLKKLAASLGTQRFLIKDYSTELSEMTGKGKLPPLPFDEKTGQYHGLPHKVTPEDIFHYIYAVLHSPAYRERYRDFLKIDFPRIPLPKGRPVFEALIPLGKTLAALHLLDEKGAPALAESRHGFPHGGDNTVHEDFGTKKFPGFDDGVVRINEDQLFKDVSPEVWAHTIGGYQPAEKWLKDRRGRTLTTDDLRHYQRMLIAIAETQRIMPEIDAAIESHGGFPGAFA